MDKYSVVIIDLRSTATKTTENATVQRMVEDRHRADAHLRDPAPNPAPFYLFDELDAAFDPQYRTAVANLIVRSYDRA